MLAQVLETVLTKLFMKLGLHNMQQHLPLLLALDSIIIMPADEVHGHDLAALSLCQYTPYNFDTSSIPVQNPVHVP